jgi:hypothetical protein
LCWSFILGLHVIGPWITWDCVPDAWSCVTPGMPTLSPPLEKESSLTLLCK